VTRALDSLGSPSSQGAQVSAALASEAQCFGEIFARYAPYVLGLVRRLGVPADDVEDVAQDVFVAVHRQLPKFEHRSALKTWLCGIALRTVANHRRRLARRRETLLDEHGVEQHALSAPLQELALERADDAARLQHALDQLSDKLREVFVLYEIEELPMSDVARAIGCPRFTAYTRLRAARAALKTRLERGAGKVKP
jgi:RNA polymerase sigma-70 factor (ECF subfamily)